MMNKDEVLVVLIRTLRDLNAVDSNLKDAEIALIKLPAIPLIANAGDQKPIVVKSLYLWIFKALTTAHPYHLNPVIEPQEPKVFDRGITVDVLAQEIANDTPDAIL
jgi:hypothetical protein